jgi:hypothetical protein
MKREQQKGRWKFGLGSRVRANDKAPGDCRGREGAVVERGPGKSEYGIRFDGQRDTVYLNSWWLDPIP